MNLFTSSIIIWYKENGRKLPWRGISDPYRIWISEIILQQTRVVQGYDYYLRFIQRFPDVNSLASASEDEVLKYWQGLGYYSRARNLHTAARSIVEQGGFPTTYAAVRALKGVGDYTAAAICSFAYGQPYAVLDGNVFRVLARYFGIDTPIDSTKGKKLFSALSQEMLNTTAPALYNQAIMDFGALQCTPASPSCSTCPLIETCVAYRENTTSLLPVKAKKIKVTHRYFQYFFVEQGVHTYLIRRDQKDIWKGLYELPLIEAETPCSLEELLASEAFQTLFPASQIQTIRRIEKDQKHVLTHRVIHADLYKVKVKEEFTLPPPFFKVEMAEVEKYAYPRLLDHFFSLLLAN